MDSPFLPFQYAYNYPINEVNSLTYWAKATHSHIPGYPCKPVGTSQVRVALFSDFALVILNMLS